VLTVPIASVTTRLPKDKDKDKDKKTGKWFASANSPKTNAPAATNDTKTAPAPSLTATATNTPGAESTNVAKADKKAPKPIEVVFLKDGERAKMVPVKLGISDNDYWEITDGLQEGQEVVSGGYRAIMRDLEDQKKVKIGPPPGDKDKDKEKDGERSEK
jgi:hypothetical protein